MKEKSVIIETIYILTFSAMMFFLSSCKKHVKVDGPITSLNAENVYTNASMAAGVLTGIYVKMSSSYFPGGGLLSMSLFPSLSADELTLFNLTNKAYLPYYENSLTEELTNTSTAFSDFWKNIYPIIFVANSAIEGLQSSTNIPESIKSQLIGEAKFIRAFCYFYLVNLYGEVPLVITTDWQINLTLPRAHKEKVYDQIVLDLKSAQSLLSENYLKSDAFTAYPLPAIERVRPTKWAATALLARVYLFKGEYSNAEIQATTIINNTTLFQLNNLNDVFLKNSTEAIWQIPSVSTDMNANTNEGRFFILPPTGPDFSHPVYLSQFVIDDFEPGDQRKVNWVNSATVITTDTLTYHYPYKYKIGAISSSAVEYSMVLRLAEVVLIRSEARVEQNNISGGKADLNLIRTRAGLPNTSAIDKAEMLTAILKERRVELFTEWGHRWLDLKRSNTIDAIMNIVTPSKGGVWKPSKALYPVPLSELLKAPQLEQNEGY